MKITKSRLLQIIREEVELHEKNTAQLEPTVIDTSAVDPTIIDTSADKNGDNKLSRKETGAALKIAIKNDKEAGISETQNVEECGMEQEDRIFGPKDDKGKRPIIQPEKNGGKLEIKIKR